MSLKTTVLFNEPQCEIATLLKEKLDKCCAVWIVTGFATVEGVEIIRQGILASPEKLKAFIIGAGTYRGFKSLDKLLVSGIAKDRLYVHLGHSSLTKPNEPYPVGFYRYRPMLHSKIYFMEMPDNQVIAFIGSHNVTGFALLGLNAEVAVMLEGSLNDPEIQKIKQHIDLCKSQAISYSPEMKEALTWWSSQFFEGFKEKVNDQTTNLEDKRTIVVFAVEKKGDLPKKDEIIYFEIPEALGQLRTLGAEVHIYVFDKKPTSPSDALKLISERKVKSLWCKAEGLETKKGALELEADWSITKGKPFFERTHKPFRPEPSQGMLQVRVQVRFEVRDNYEYLFDSKETWEPVLENTKVKVKSAEDRNILASLKLETQEDKEWLLVSNLRLVEPKGDEKYKAAIKDTSPGSGNFILVSLRRRNLSKKI